MSGLLSPVPGGQPPQALPTFSRPSKVVVSGMESGESLGSTMERNKVKEGMGKVASISVRGSRSLFAHLLNG